MDAFDIYRKLTTGTIRRGLKKEQMLPKVSFVIILVSKSAVIHNIVNYCNRVGLKKCLLFKESNGLS